jgi:hypothetical protein
MLAGLTDEERAATSAVLRRMVGSLEGGAGED